MYKGDRRERRKKGNHRWPSGMWDNVDGAALCVMGPLQKSNRRLREYRQIARLMVRGSVATARRTLGHDSTRPGSLEMARSSVLMKRMKRLGGRRGPRRPRLASCGPPAAGAQPAVQRHSVCTLQAACSPASCRLAAAQRGAPHSVGDVRASPALALVPAACLVLRRPQDPAPRCGSASFQGSRRDSGLRGPATHGSHDRHDH